MGSLITPDAYLVDWVLLHKPGARLAGQLLRCQIVTANRTGHEIRFSEETVQRAIRANRLTLAIPDVTTVCVRCRCAAWLRDWHKASILPVGASAKLADALAVDNEPWRLLYLRPCRGHLVAVNEIEGLRALKFGRR